MKPGKWLARGGPRRGHLLSSSPLPPPQFPFSSGASRGRLTGGLEQSRVGVSEMMAGKRRSSCSGARKLLVNWFEGGIFSCYVPILGSDANIHVPVVTMNFSLWMKNTCSYSCPHMDAAYTLYGNSLGLSCDQLLTYLCSPFQHNMATSGKR
jgi:hypothetical protein